MNHEIQTLLKKVFSDLNYEKLILFGSRARGDFSERSDYDILKSNDEIDYYKDKIGSVVRSALKEGVALC